jgi:hypothetical protein
VLKLSHTGVSWVLAPRSSSGLMGCHQSLELLKCRDACSVVSADLDDVVECRHLQNQVTVVGDGHELVQGRPTQNSIEGEVDLRDVKEDALHAVVLRHLKYHQEGDATARHNGHQTHS